MAKTRWRRNVYFSGTFTAVGSMNVTDLTVSTLVVSDSLAMPALTIDLGTASHSDQTGDLNGVYLTYNLDGAASSGVTHGLGTTVKGWWIVNQNAPLASGTVVYCSDLDTSTTTLTLAALGTNIFKVFAFG